MRTRRFVASCLGAMLVMRANLARSADEKARFKLAPLDFQVGTKDSKLKATGAFDSDGDNMHDGYVVGITFKAPLTDVEDTAQARLDDLGTGWRVGASVGKEWQWPVDTGDPRADRRGTKSPEFSAFLGVEGSYGPRKFTFYPSGNDEDQSQWTHSFDLSISGYVHQAAATAPPWALQLKLGYARDWKEADEVGIVRDDRFVKEKKVLDPPSAKPALSARLFFYRRILKGSSFAMGPSLAYAGEGKAGQFDPSGGNHVGRIELWLYYFPLADPVNVRLGASPFLDGYFQGRNKDDNVVEPGLLFQVKIGAPIFVY